MNVILPTQPMPAPVAEACAWLSAAERHHSGTLDERVTAGDLIDDLIDVDPPYPMYDRTRPTAPLAEAAPHAIAALEAASGSDLPVPDLIRIAAAIGALRHAIPQRPS